MNNNTMRPCVACRVAARGRGWMLVVTLLEHPAVQGGVAPLVAALIVAAIFARTRFAWLAILAAYVTMVALTTGFSLHRSRSRARRSCSV